MNEPGSLIQDLIFRQMENRQLNPHISPDSTKVGIWELYLFLIMDKNQILRFLLAKNTIYK